MEMYKVMQNVRLANNSNEWVSLYTTHSRDNAIEYARVKDKIPGVEVSVLCTVETEINWRG